MASAPTPSSPRVADTPVNKRPVSKAPEALTPRVARETFLDSDFPKPRDDAGKNVSIDLLLDVDAPAEVLGPDSQNQTMSPSCADLTGLDFPSGNKSRMTSPPSSPLAQCTTHSPATNIRSELWKSLHKLIETSRLAQQLIDTAHGTRDDLFENLFNALVLESRHAAELTAEIANNPQPSSAGRSLVEGWLSHTLTDRVTYPNQKTSELAKSSFNTYRSPARSESSSGIAQKRSPDSLNPGLSPRKIAASEGLFGIENLRLSDEPPKTFSLAASKATSSAKHSRAVSSLAQSIHAAPSVGGYNPERPKAMGSPASHSKEYQASALGSFSTSTTGGQAGGDQPVTARGPAPAVPPGLGPFAAYSQTTRAEAAPDPSKSGRSTGPKIIGVALYEPKPTGPKVIGVPPFMPNYPVVRTSTDTAQPGAHPATFPQTSSTQGPAQHRRKPSVIGPMPYTPSKSIHEGMNAAEPLSSGSSNVPKEAAASASPRPKYRPSPLSKYLGESIFASAWAQESYKDPSGTAHQPKAQTSANIPQTENKAPPKVRVIGPQPYMPKN